LQWLIPTSSVKESQSLTVAIPDEIASAGQGHHLNDARSGRQPSSWRANHPEGKRGPLRPGIEFISTSHCNHIGQVFITPTRTRVASQADRPIGTQSTRYR
jgi:hypothetical protein